MCGEVADVDCARRATGQDLNVEIGPLSSNAAQDADLVGRARAAADGAPLAESRDAFFATSDIVSLHVRLKPDTRGIITAQDLAAMQPRSLLVNTSRSGLIAPGVLEAEIARNRIHAAVDVFDHEPMTDAANILATHPNVLATPHIGYVTEDEFDLQFNDIFDQVNAFATGAPIHMINPEVLG